MARARRRGSIRIGNLFGIDVFLHSTFLILLGLLAVLPLLRGDGLVSALEFIALVSALFSCVLFHEFGHALTARRFGIRTHDITLLPFGGIASLERLPDRPRDELLVAVAGPAVNAVIALLLFVVVAMQHAGTAYLWMDPGNDSALETLMWMNVTLGIFNLVPAFPMDGGRMLRAVLATRLGPARATRIAARIGQLLSVGFAVLGVLFNPMLLVIAAFVFMAAGAEHRAQQMRSALQGVQVWQAMQPRVAALEAGETLSSAMAGLLASDQQAFPVLFNDQVVGLVTRANLIDAVAEQQRDVSLWTLMQRGVPTLSPEVPVSAALKQLQAGRFPALPVVQDDQVVGLISLEDIRELVAARRAAGFRPETLRLP